MSRPLLVFDLDGTLVDTAHDLILALNAALESEGLSPVPRRLVGHLVGHGARTMVERGLAYHQVRAGSAQIDRLIAAFLAHYADNIAVESRPFPGLIETLDRFEAAGWAMAVCTNKAEALAHTLLGALDLSRRFPVVTGGDTFAVKKPDARHLIGTIERAGGDRFRTVMIGDSRTDIDAARNAGVPVIAVTFGYTEVPVEKLGPDVVISHFDGLWDAVDGLGIAQGPIGQIAAE